MELIYKSLMTFQTSFSDIPPANAVCQLNIRHSAYCINLRHDILIMIPENISTFILSRFQILAKADLKKKIKQHKSVTQFNH